MFGPSLRTIRALKNKAALVDREMSITDELDRMDNNTLLHINTALHPQSPTDLKLSHQIYLVVPNTHRRMTQGFITHFVFALVLAKARDVSTDTLLEFHRLCMKTVTARPLGGHQLEGLIHERLPRGGYFAVSAMDRKNPKNVNDKNVICSPNAQSTASNTLEIGRPGSPVNIVPTSSGTPFTPEMLPKSFYKITDSLAHSTYLYPVAPNQATFDSLVSNQSAKKVFLFQVTVSPKHDAKEAGITFAKARFPHASIHLVVVSPNEAQKLTMLPEVSPLITGIWHCHTNQLVGS